MANKKSAEKQNRSRIKRTAANNSRRSEMRTAIKKVRAAVAAKKGDEAQALLKEAVSLIDRAGGRQLISKNTSARLVSRLTTAANQARA
ncbi:MAG: 30S ribosomal protein S20 [Deltaproteobacteria bacterium]|nr:30S ribosomal protein S20 [Deltaproteobacteria bacterium]